MRPEQEDEEYVTRYAPTYVDQHGTRMLMQPAKNFETREEAQASLDRLIGSMSADAIHAAWGNNPRFDVRPCRCRPGDLVPLETYFECW